MQEIKWYEALARNVQVGDSLLLTRREGGLALYKVKDILHAGDRVVFEVGNEGKRKSLSPATALVLFRKVPLEYDPEHPYM